MHAQTVHYVLKFAINLMIVTSLNRNISVWSAIAKDYSILKETTSGGIADILAKN